MDLVVAVAELHNSIDDTARMSQQGGFDSFVGGASAEDGAASLLVAGWDLTDGF
ncbi:MAG TPA: hypothetical protein VGG41_08855 [Solirubrobacteraceae bacterium]